MSITINTKKLENRQQLTLIVFSYVTLLCSLSVYGFWQALLPIEPAVLLLGQMGLLAVLLLVATSCRLYSKSFGFSTGDSK